jgi:hypothetical protein
MDYCDNSVYICFDFLGCPLEELESKSVAWTIIEHNLDLKEVLSSPPSPHSNPSPNRNFTVSPRDAAPLKTLGYRPE